MSYSDRLIWLGADCLATHRLKFDLVLFYDIAHDNIDVDLPIGVGTGGPGPPDSFV